MKINWLISTISTYINFWHKLILSRDNFIELKIYYDSLIEAIVTEYPEFDIFEMLSKYLDKRPVFTNGYTGVCIYLYVCR